MASLAYLSLKELNMLTKARKVNSYENMSRQQLESTFTIPSAPTPTQRLAPQSKKCMYLPASKPENVHTIIPQELKNVHLCLPQDLQHLHPLAYPRTANQKR